MTSDAPEGLVAARQLLDHATDLGIDLPPLLDRIGEYWPDVRSRLAAGEQRARHSKTAAVFEAIRAQHLEYLGEIVPLIDSGSSLIQSYQQLGVEERLREFQRLVRAVDPTKIADEELLKNLTRSRDILLAAPGVLVFSIAASEIFLYIPAYYYHAALSSFLGKETQSAFALRATEHLIEAAALEAAGKVVPFLGLIQAALELSVPQLERDMEKLRAAVEEFDRIYTLEDGIDHLRTFLGQTRAVISAATDEFRRAEAAFVREYDWLIDVLGPAAAD